MRTCLLFCLVITLVFSAAAQPTFPQSNPAYGFDTVLKGGYQLSFQADDSLQYLYLKKGSRTVGQLSSTTRGLPAKNLGYLVADFPDHFILVHSYGSGNPHYIDLIRKATGKNLLRSGAVFIDVEKQKDFLLYYHTDDSSARPMVLYHIPTGRKETFPFPEAVRDAAEIWTRMKIEQLTARQLVVRYRMDSGSGFHAYRR